ncbi:MAG: hypothetical protein M1825_001190 [Sarcosagium campestre]|nr:MAG: hypothetical protein M1825_001190 [Sarcosagium campestre]
MTATPPPEGPSMISNLQVSAPVVRAFEREAESPVENVEVPEYSLQRNRKYSSTGGGRAWTEEEEVYLLQTRLQKMPYKHIATHLRKTELACRLHYHQLSHGTTRRKRAASVSSASSIQSPMTPEQRLSPDVDFVTSATTPEGYSSIDSPQIQAWKSRQSSPYMSSLSNQKSLPPLKPASQSPQVPLRFQAGKQSLRLDCSVATQRPVPVINQDRLRQIYDAHRSSIWKMIAADYGEGVDAGLLEEAWRKGFSPSSTPDELSGRTDSAKTGSSTVPILPPMQLERAFSPINRSVSASPAPNYSGRSLPALTASSASSSSASSSSAGPPPTNSIASLLTDSVETRRPSRLGSVSEVDTTMRDAQQ